MDYEKIIDQLRGTYENLHPLLEEFQIVDNMEVFRAIDDEIFTCEVCGWWCEISEMSDTDQVCRDCEEDA
jgi:hypothetical protein